MLRGASVAAQAFASQALANAAAYHPEEGQNAIVRAGAIPLLLKLLGEGKAQTPAAYALARLASTNPAVQMAVADAGGIALLLSLLNGRNLDAQVQAAAALAEMARDNVDTQNTIARAGGIGPLLALLSSRSTAAQSKGMAALAQLSRNNRENQNAIAGSGGIRPLVHLLNAPVPDVQAHAAFALMECCRDNHANQQVTVTVCARAHVIGARAPPPPPPRPPRWRLAKKHRRRQYTLRYPARDAEASCSGGTAACWERAPCRWSALSQTACSPSHCRVRSLWWVTAASPS